MPDNSKFYGQTQTLALLNIIQVHVNSPSKKTTENF